MLKLNWWRGVLRVWALLSALLIVAGILDNDLMSFPDGKVAIETEEAPFFVNDGLAYSPGDLEEKAQKAESLGKLADAAGLRDIRDFIQITVDREKKNYTDKVLRVSKGAAIWLLGSLAFLFLVRWVIGGFRST